MSVFGGDSWAREAQYRKRRVDDLITEGVDASAYKKLPSGKFACLVCPNTPILDTPIMLRTHMNGSRHQAAASRCRDKELALQEEVKKRIALSECGGPSVPVRQREAAAKPLIELARKAASEVVTGHISQKEVKSEKANSAIPLCEGSGSYGDFIRSRETVGEVPQLEYQERREKELKFTAAGWKWDCHGRWYKDENVEFDSDEEDPNIVLNGIT